MHLDSEYINIVSNFIKRLPINIVQFIIGICPIIKWLPRYDARWLMNDLVSGFTCGLLCIPVALANAKLASLPLQFGLYTCYFAILVYPIFGTSKDISVGATAVLSSVIGQLITAENLSPLDAIIWATSVSFVAGILQLIMGFLGLGIVVDFIPMPVIQGFITGAAFGVIIGQLPSVLGISGVDGNAAPYLVITDMFKKMNGFHYDIIFGISAVIFLLALTEISKHVSRSNFNGKWIDIAKNSVTVILFTLISYLINRSFQNPIIKIVGSLPSGFNYFHFPSIPHAQSIFKSAITIVIVSTIEHMSIAKSFGRINKYDAVPNQELIALGFGNIVGSFFGCWPACGSFTRSAISSQTGSKSPLTAFFTSLIILGAIYFLMPLLYYMPNSVLSAVMIVALSDLIARPASINQLIQVDTLDFLSFLLVSISTLFFTIENSIITAISFTIIIILIRIARPNWCFLVKSEQTGLWISEKKITENIRPSPAGIFIVRIEEGMIYPNSSYLNASIKENLQKRTSSFKYDDKFNRSWADLSQSNSQFQKDFPILKSLIFDFSTVNFIDMTGLQMLSDLKRDLESYSGNVVDLHFSNVNDRCLYKIEYFITNMCGMENDISDENIDFKKFIHSSNEDAVIGATCVNGFKDGMKLKISIDTLKFDDFLEGIRITEPMNALIRWIY